MNRVGQILFVLWINAFFLLASAFDIYLIATHSNPVAIALLTFQILVMGTIANVWFFLKVKFKFLKAKQIAFGFLMAGLMTGLISIPVFAVSDPLDRTIEKAAALYGAGLLLMTPLGAAFLAHEAGRKSKEDIDLTIR